VDRIVCFFVSYNRHWFNRFLGANLGHCLSTLYLSSDACCADLPLALLGAPVSIGRAGSRSLGSAVAKTENLGAALPGQDRLRPFGIIGATIPSNRSPLGIDLNAPWRIDRLHLVALKPGFKPIL